MYVCMCIHIYIYIYIYIYPGTRGYSVYPVQAGLRVASATGTKANTERCSWLTGGDKKPNRTGRTEPNRLISEPARTGCGTERSRTEPDQTMTRSKSAGRTASNQKTTIAKSNRTETMTFRKLLSKHLNKQETYIIHLTKLTNKQTNKQTDNQTDKQTNKQTDRQTKQTSKARKVVSGAA